uniref:Xylose transport system permease protein XylH n=1 Tax=Thermogemmatispora argillosa TaxID=2045280 RepID=A0A455T1D1_9CHLR|nr:ABC transporter permease [Thermogemmatispora argillosa]
MSEAVKQKQPAPATSVEVPSRLPRPTVGQLLRTDLGFLPVLLTLLVIAAYFALTTNGLFLTPRNLSNLVLQITQIGVLALGSTLVLLLGEIDLSVAAVSTLCAVVMGVLVERHGVPAGWAILAALVTGAITGFINGLLVAFVRIPSFIVTLAASIGYSGLLLYLLAGQSTLIIHDAFIVSLANNYLPDVLGIGLPTLVLLLYIGFVVLNYVRRQRAGLRTQPLPRLLLQIVIVAVIVEGAVALFESYLGVPQSVVFLIGLILLCWLLLTKTPFGRYVYAVGGNAEAARRAGINVPLIRVAVFTMCSTLAAIGGVLAASRGLAVASQIDPTLLLDAIAAAVIGGVSLFGGKGSVWSLILGALIIGSLENGLDLKSQGTDVKEMVEGVVLVIAVAADALIRRAQARRGR